MTKILYVIPNQECKFCRGDGDVYDIVDYGLAIAQMPTPCECVTEQIPEEYDECQLEYISRIKVNELKEQWLSDPCWDIYETEGFELFNDELKRFQESWEKEWQLNHREEIIEFSGLLGIPGNVVLAQYIKRLEERIENLENKD